ncbi:MAG TPA: bifunctional phosphopantothenoylcysteine decarboxylase/phosphopantothenate synthase, partial [Rhodospirillales bacterium]|nr:bifunctional phosphopantothenoylcysteine decarboxylase/phosphopantothenate synthase [Rhodospirillales bacterium]
MSVEKRVLLIVSGGIAAYKSLELVRNLKNAGIAIRCILTPGGARFVTTLSLATLSEDKVYEDLFSVADQGGIGHIELSRDADLLVVAPATADIIAKMRAGIADDLATAALLATNKPVLIAPAMNVRMWGHEATQENMAVLNDRGVNIIGPDEGDMACGE